MPKSIGRKGIIAIVLALIAVIGVASLAFFTDRVDHSMQFTTASFSADGYKLTRTAPEGPFCAGEEVTATLKESNTGDDDVNSIISMKATWVSPDTALSIFGNANAADNAKLSIDGADISYKVSTDKKSITFDLPAHVLTAGTKDKARDLTLTIPASFKSTGRIEFTFEKVVVAQDGGGFSKEYSRTDLNAAGDLDYSVKVGWAASSIEAQNGKALMGYLTDKNSSGKFGIEFELAFNYTESPMKDFSSRTGAKWSYYKGAVDRLTFVEGMTTIGDYAFPDFSAVKSVSFPTTVKTIGISAFDASGLTGTVTIPATVKEIKSLAFGNLPNAKTFTFGHTTDSLTLPDNTAAGKRNTGAFYVPTHVDTTVNTTVEAIMYGYKWHDGYDNRRLVPTLNAQDTWFRTYTSGSNYTAKLDEDVLETITFADYHMPVTGETSWDASDPSVPGTVTAFLSADKKSLILAGNGYGLIFANEDSSGAFGNLTALKTVSNTDLLDTRNATTMADMFNFDKKLANISVTTWNVSKVTDMSNMFYCCDSLPSIDLKPNTCTAKDGSGQYTAWNTASLKNTSGMFMDYGGENHALTTVNTTGWNTSKLEDTSYMFMECRGLTAVKGIESWNVSSLKDAHNMFQDCQSLQTINVSNWNTASLENTSVMFSSCHSLRSIDITKWDMSKVTKSNAMFSYCKSFTDLTLPKSLTVIGSYFAGNCPKLTTITFNHPAGTEIQFSSEAFYIYNNDKAESEAGYIEYTPVNPLGTKVVTSNAQVLEYDWTSDHRGYVVEIKTVEGGTLTGTPLATYNGRKAVVAINGKTITFADTAEEAYAYDGATVQYSQGDTAKTVTLDKNTKTWVMPVVDDKVTEADVVVTPKWKVTALPMLAKEDTWQYNGTDTNGDPTTPIDYDLLETINIVNKYTPAAGETSWDASANQTVDGVEYKGKVTVYLSADKKTLTISGNGYGKVFANPDSMWAFTKAYDGMAALKKINGANVLDTQLVVNAGGMFAQNRMLESVDVSNWNTGNIQNTSAAGGYYGMFMNCAKLKSLNVSNWNTKSVTEMSRMFSGCSLLSTIDVSKWNTSSCVYMNDMFYGAGISQIDMTGWNTGNLKYTYNMFKECANLTGIDLSTWDESIVNSAYDMFRDCKALTSVNLNGWNLSNLEDGTTDSRKGSAGMFSGCTALTELNIPASLKVFGQNFAANCTSLNKITFLHDAGTVLTFPTAGATYGAFYVDPAMRTTQIVGQNTSAKAYSWVKDQRAAIPTLAAQKTWYKGTTAKSAITGIEIVDSYSGASTESWDASAAQDGSVKAYINGTKLIVAGNGYGKVLANADSTSAFNAFTNVTSFTGLNKLDTSNVTNMQTMFNNLDNIQTLDLSSFNTSKVTNFYSIFGGNHKLTTLNLTGWDTSAAKDMGQMFYVCNALTTINGLSSFNTANVTDMSGMFHGCKAMTSLDLSNFNTAKVKTLSMMFYQCSNLETVKLTSFDTSAVTNMSAAFDGCHKLQEITLGKDFKFVGTDGYLPTPSSTYIPQADGNWYVKGLTKHYTPAELAAVTRVRAVTYSAIPGTDPGTGGGSGGGGGTLEGEVRWPVQSGALTYNGNAQSPSWSGYASTKMTIGGTTSGTNAGTYTATFTPKDGYCWPDGTADTVSVTWKIGKAAGSLFVTPTEMTIALNDTTGTITVARAGDGAITATSDKTSVATVEVNGNKITVTKKDAGTANITVKVAEGTNHKAPAGKTVVVTCKTTPELNAKNTWYTGSTAKSAITEIELKDSYTAIGNEIESWDASAAQNKTVMAYVVEGTNGKKLILAGNGSGKIVANADSTSAFNGFTALTAFTGLNKLDTSNVTNMQTMFNNLDNIQTLDLSSFNTSKVTKFYSIFGGNDKLTTLNLTGWDTSAAKDMGQMFYVCNALTTINGLSSFNTANVTDMSGMFHGCKAMTSLDLSNFNTAKVKTLSMMFYQCSNLETVKLTSFDTSNVTSLYAMFQYCYKLKAADLSSFNTAKVTNMRSMFGSCKAVESLDLSSFDTSAVTNMSAAFDGCQTLQTVTLGKDFKFVGTDGYLPAPSATYISGADGNWYVAGTDTGYTPTELAAVTRVRNVTYSAVKPETVGGLDVGESVFLNVDGKRMEFIVVNQGNPDTSIYDDSCNGTWLLMKDVYENRQWHSGDINEYESSDIHAYLNNTFLNLFDSNIQDAIKQVKLPYRKNGGSGGTDQSGANGLSAKIFLLSGYELGWTTSDSQHFPVDGAKLAYFESGTGTSANNKRIANFGGSAASWLLRSPYTALDNGVWVVSTGGDHSGGRASGSYGIRPALVLPSTVTVDNDRNVGGSTGGGGGDIPADLNLAVPEQVGTLTANGSEQSPTWKNYDSSKMTISGTTSAVEAGTYTVTFTLNDGYAWFDGTAEDKNVQWTMESGAPMLAAGNTWYKSSVRRGLFTKIELIDSGTPSGTIVEHWNADVDNSGSIKAYITGSSGDYTLTIAGNGSGSIMANPDSTYLFGHEHGDVKPNLAFSAVTNIAGMGLLDTSKVTTMNSMFDCCSALTALDVSGFDTSSVTNMAGMFGSCSALTALDVSGFDTSKVTSMNSMFYCCSSLTTLDVSKLNTAKVEGMSDMFFGCRKLTALDVSGFDTSSVTDMYGMFYDCSALTSLDLSGFDTSSVTSMASMFQGCTAMTALDLSGFDTSKVTTMNSMFSGCSKLTSLDVSGFDTSRATNMSDMFYYCIKLQAVTLGKDFKFVGTDSYLPTPSATYISGADGKWYDSDTRTGYTPSGLASVTRNAPVTYVAVKPGPMLAERMSWYKSTKVTDKRLFKTIAIINSGKPSGTIVEQWNADVDNSGSIKAYITGSSGSYTLTIAGDGSGSIMANPDSNYAFSNTGVVSFSNVTSFTGTKLLNTSRVTDMSYMFNDCSALTSLDVSGFDTSRVTDMRSMFYNCTQLKSLDVSGFDTSRVTDMGYMFLCCSALTSLDVSGFDTSRVTSMVGMFGWCKALTSLDLSGFDTSKVTTMDNMFRDCTKLKSVTLGKAFKFVGTDGYLPTPSSTYITGADGKWYDTNTGTGYTPEALASVERTKAVTYSAVKLERIGGLDVGESVFLNVDGKRMEFIVVNQGNPDTSIYDDSCNGTWLLMKDIYEKRQWHSANVNNLENSTIHSYLNSTFLNLFDSNIQKAIKQVKLPYRKNGGSGGTDQSGANGLSCKVFLLSGYEVGWTTSDNQYFPVDGAKLAYFESGTGTSANNKRIANFGGSAAYWWLRSPDNNTTFNLWCVQPGGSKSVSNARGSFGIRPALVLPSTVTVDNDRNVGGSTGGGGGDIPADLNLAVPKQSGTLTYTGSAQSPSWSNYDASKMTMGGTTTGTNAGSYTTTFALNDGFKWADGTTGTKSVIWKIGKATGSVSFSKDSLSIDKNSTTDTLDVTRTGTGAITATSSDTSVATVTVNGTKVTVTKVGDGTATIIIKVAADTNYKEASKTCSVTCVGIPTLAYGSTWYKGSTDKASITKIQLKDSYTPSGTPAESWNADARNSGSIKAYVEGTTLTIAGNGTGKIKANALSWSVFNGFSSATAITGLDLMDTSNALTMEAMFYGCKALTSMDVSKFDTSNVTSMRAMFYECENLTSLNVSKFDTASVTNVEAMFQGCKALTAVGDVSGWNTAKVTSMYQVFYGCEKLAALDLSGWNTTNVTNMQAMFLDCTSLTSVGDISGWNTAKVTEMALLFGNCEKLASLDVSKFNTAAVTNMNAMFFNCSALTTLDVSGFDTAKTTNLAAMFSGCVSLTSLDVSNWNTSNVTTMEATFQSCKKLTTMGDVSGWDTSKVTNMREMFCQCNLITSVDVTNWKTGNVTNMNGIFSNCEKLTSVGDLSGWDTSSATDMGLIFNSCFKLTGMGDISQWDTSNATKMNCLFATCESLTELDLSGWDTSKVTDMNNIFGGYEHEQLEEGEIAGACVLLRKITLGAKFKFVGTDSYLPEPDSRYISGADGKWYAGSTGYTPAELAGLSRTEAVTYVAVKGTKTMSILSGDNAVSGYSISE